MSEWVGGTGLHGGSERRHVVMEGVPQVHQGEGNAGGTELLAGGDATEPAPHHHHMDPLWDGRLAPHL